MTSSSSFRNGNSVSPDFAFVTPSYAPDFERCKLLSDSIEACSSGITHYIIVDSRDYALFNQIKKSNTELITVESILPWWIRRTPFYRKIWLNFRGSLIRNWVLQQIVKIQFSQIANEKLLIYVDSDNTFIRPFDPKTFVSKEDSAQLRLFKTREDYLAKHPKAHQNWYKNAFSILDCKPLSLVPIYVGNIITWQPENITRMCRYIEELHNKSWIDVVSKTWDFSEYVLYGVFVDLVLGEAAHHFSDDSCLCYEYWKTEPLNKQELKTLFEHEISPENIAVMISAKSKTPIEYYRPLVENLWKQG